MAVSCIMFSQNIASLLHLCMQNAGKTLRIGKLQCIITVIFIYADTLFAAINIYFLISLKMHDITTILSIVSKLVTKSMKFTNEL